MVCAGGADHPGVALESADRCRSGGGECFSTGPRKSLFIYQLELARRSGPERSGVRPARTTGHMTAVAATRFGEEPECHESRQSRVRTPSRSAGAWPDVGRGRRPRGARTPRATPNTVPSAGASGSSTRGSCRGHRVREQRASRASPQSAWAARNARRTAGTGRQRGWPARSADRAVPRPRCATPDPISRPPDVTVTFPPGRRPRAELSSAGQPVQPTALRSRREARRGALCLGQRAR